MCSVHVPSPVFVLSIKSPPTTSLLLTSHGTSFRSLILVFSETFTHTRRVFRGHTFSLTFGCMFSSAFSLPIYTNPLSTFSMRFLVQSLFHPCRVKFTKKQTRKTRRELMRELSSVLMGDLARQIRRELENTQGN